MNTETLSIRIRKDLKEKMKLYNDIDWRMEIESFIESKIREMELKKTIIVINNILSGIDVSKEPAWKTIREFRKVR
ncbi:MAG: hypothetical protein QXI93_03465 [Candidatus Methanomethylicia archaeon]